MSPCAPPLHGHFFRGGRCCGGGGEDLLAEPTGTGLSNSSFQSSGDLTEGEYYLAESITLTSYNITVSGNVTLDLNGYTLTGIGSGSTITIPDGASLTVTDSGTEGTIANTGNSNGTLISSTRYGGVILVQDGGSLTLEGGTIEGGSVGQGCGGGISVLGGTVTMNGGTITDNVARNGGGIYVSRGTVVLNGGTITDNIGSWFGGGICLNGGTMEMCGGTIFGNTARDGGGGISISGGTLILSGGTVSDNTVSSDSGIGGGIYFSYGTLEMQDEADSEPITIKDNEDSGGESSNLLASRFIEFGTDMSEGSSVGVSVPTAVGCLARMDRYDSRGTFSSDSGYGVEEYGGYLCIGANPTYSESMNFELHYEIDGTEGSLYSETLGGAFGFVPLVTEIVMLNDYTETEGFGLILMYGDVKLTSEYKLTVEEACGITVSYGRTLEISGNITIEETKGQFGVAVMNGTLVYGEEGSPTLTSSYSTAVYAFIRMSGSGTLLMYGGTISNNTSDYNGGGISISGGTFKMYGGTISGNNSSGDGAGIYIGGGTVEIYGGTITGNVSTNSEEHSGVYIESESEAIVKIGGGAGALVISGNGGEGSAHYGVYLSSGEYLTVAGDLPDGSDVVVTTAEAPSASGRQQFGTVSASAFDEGMLGMFSYVGTADPPVSVVYEGGNLYFAVLDAQYRVDLYTVGVTVDGDAGSGFTFALKEGYTWTGVEYRSSGDAVVTFSEGDVLTASLSEVAGHVTIVVRAHAQHYTVRFLSTDGSTVYGEQTMTYGISTALDDDGVTRSGYTLAGWSTVSGGSVVYSAGSRVLNLSGTGGTVDLYAVWNSSIIILPDDRRIIPGAADLSEDSDDSSTKVLACAAAAAAAALMAAFIVFDTRRR